MKKILFKATQEEVLLISSENIDNLFDSIPTDAKCCVLADKKVLDMHDSLRKQIENKNFIIYEISNPEEEIFKAPKFNLYCVIDFFLLKRYYIE